MAWKSKPVAKYSVQLQKDSWAFQLFDSSSKKLAEIWVRFNGTVNNPVKVPATGTWPDTAHVRIDVAQAQRDGLLDLLRNEGTLDFAVDADATPIVWNLASNFEPTGEGEL